MYACGCDVGVTGGMKKADDLAVVVGACGRSVRLQMMLWRKYERRGVHILPAAVAILRHV